VHLRRALFPLGRGGQEVDFAKGRLTFVLLFWIDGFNHSEA
jgi:hypothetical protein